MELLYKDESYKIIGACMEVYNELGKGHSEVIYKDALEYEFSLRNIPYERERLYKVKYKDIVLPHYFKADFVAFDKICKSIFVEYNQQKVLIEKYTINLISETKLN